MIEFEKAWEGVKHAPRRMIQLAIGSFGWGAKAGNESPRSRCAEREVVSRPTPQWIEPYDGDVVNRVLNNREQRANSRQPTRRPVDQRGDNHSLSLVHRRLRP